MKTHILLSSELCLEAGSPGKNASATSCFINGRGESQQKHLVSCATICVYFSSCAVVCNEMRVLRELISVSHTCWSSGKCTQFDWKFLMTISKFVGTWNNPVMGHFSHPHKGCNKIYMLGHDSRLNI